MKRFCHYKCWQYTLWTFQEAWNLKILLQNQFDSVFNTVLFVWIKCDEMNDLHNLQSISQNRQMLYVTTYNDVSNASILSHWLKQLGPFIHICCKCSKIYIFIFVFFSVRSINYFAFNTSKLYVDEKILKIFYLKFKISTNLNSYTQREKFQFTHSSHTECVQNDFVCNICIDRILLHNPAKHMPTV